MRVLKATFVIGMYLAWPAVCSRISLDCLSFMRPCISPVICKSELLRNICNSEDSSCQMQSSEHCNATIQAILVHSPLWSKCMCPDDDSCSTLQLLGSLCPSYSDSHCRLATRRFFFGLPQIVAEMLIFCQCEQMDQDCQDIRNILQSNSCSVDQMPWNCLEMLDNCSTDKLCRKTFEGFLSKCFGPEDAPFSGYSTREPLHLIDFDFFLSGDTECRKAFVATMGTELQSTCTCHGLHHDNFYRCNMLQQAVQNKTHFRTMRNVSTQSHVYKPEQSRVWFNDQPWYFLVYVFMVVGILIVVAIVLHKLRRMHSLSKKQGYSLPEDSTKSLHL
ncbi:GDNF family receptor alpha-like [Salminus brasiliensis]|uniref:GDNF family receptor alpha-like n=1 Tax=Salminus brasiliensis TaxID=930266 RepID=UPI003B82D87A